MSLKSRLSIVGVIAGVLLPPAAGQAELGSDTHIQQTGEMRIEVDRRVFEEFARLFELGYPPATVMMHAVSTGMSINDILYIAVKSDTDRAAEFYATAASLLPALPGWVCQADSDRSRYTREIDLDELDADPTIEELAQLYFREGRRVIPFPDWTEGRVHMEASVEELAGLAGEGRWYVPGEDHGTGGAGPGRPVFVSLYPHDDRIIVDSVDRIRRSRQQGVERLPVVLVYNDDRQRPVSSFPADTTLAELARRFYEEGLTLTAVPEWRDGDYHKRATLEELREVVDIPEREDIPEARWNALERTLRSNDLEPPRPLLMTLVRSGQGRAWVSDPATLSVASQLGIETLPVVMFYHRIDRRACGQPSSCQDVLCEAATAAGAPREVCGSDDRQTAADADAGGPDAAGKGRVASKPDTGVYQGLRYTQNQCKS